MNMIFSTKRGREVNISQKQTQNVSDIQRKSAARNLNIASVTSFKNMGGLTYGMINIVESGLKGCGHCSGAK